MTSAILADENLSFAKDTPQGVITQKGLDLASEFYRSGSIQSIELTVSPEDLAKLQRALPERIYVPATFRWQDTTIPRVAVRYKGDSSSHPGHPHKRSFLIKFNEYIKEQRFLGLRRVALDNGIQFGSLFSECLITDVLRDQGIPASRCNHARLKLNGKNMGVYVNVERLDASFLESRFGSSTGLLYKVHHGGAGANLQYAGDAIEPYQATFDSKTDAADEGYESLVQWIQSIDSKPATSYGEQLEATFEWENFLRTTAIMLFAGAFDQLTGWNPHNYYLYRHPESERWHYLPWDLDVGFADRAFGRIPVIEGWNAAWPIPGGSPRPLLENIVAHPGLLARYRKIADEILQQYFEPSILIPKLNALHELLRKQLELDPFPHRRMTHPQDKDYEDIVASMRAFIQYRYALARQQLDQPGERPPPPRQMSAPNQQPRPGKRISGAPSGLELVAKDSTFVVLSWTDHAEGEEGHILQRAEDSSELSFQNILGKPGPNSTDAIDRQVISGRTYHYRVYALFATPRGPEGTVVSNVIKIAVP